MINTPWSISQWRTQRATGWWLWLCPLVTFSLKVVDSHLKSKSYENIWIALTQKCDMPMENRFLIWILYIFFFRLFGWNLFKVRIKFFLFTCMHCSFIYSETAKIRNTLAKQNCCKILNIWKSTFCMVRPKVHAHSCYYFIKNIFKIKYLNYEWI